jgi:putative endonuclease
LRGAFSLHFVARGKIPRLCLGTASAIFSLPVFVRHSSSCLREALPLLSLRGALLRKGDEAISCIMSWVTKQYYVYIITNVTNTVLYVGITNDLTRRIYEHKEKLVSGFTKNYNTVKLVYYEVFEDIENAILREKQIKAGSRQKKVQLINSVNEEWRDLYDEL